MYREIKQPPAHAFSCGLKVGIGLEELLVGIRFKIIIGAWVRMVVHVVSYELVGHFSNCEEKIPSHPKVGPPIPLLRQREALDELL